MSNSYSEKAHPSSIYTRFNTRYVIHLFSYTNTVFEWSQMKIIKLEFPIFWYETFLFMFKTSLLLLNFCLCVYILNSERNAPPCCNYCSHFFKSAIALLFVNNLPWNFVWQGTRTPPDTWFRPFGTCICCSCWDQSFFRTCRYFSGLCSSDIPWYFIDFAF